MKNKIMLWAMVAIFTILTVTNLLATQAIYLAQKSCHETQCDDQANTECQEYCSLFNDYCFDVQFVYGICDLTSHECWHLYKLFCVNGHWDYYYCVYGPSWDCYNLAPGKLSR
jgi:hypothetical protein